jgi:transcription initiation factor TFIIB
MISPYKTHKIESDNCCGSKNLIITNEGMKVCSNCGMEFDRSYISTEKRAYNSEEVKNRRRTEPRWRSYGPRTVIGINSTDINGSLIDGKRRSFFNRLSKIQGSLVNSIERNFWEARPKLNLLSRKLHIPEHISETAWRIYGEVARQKLTMGRSIESFVTASIYTSIRIHEFPRLLEEIAEVSFLTIKNVHRALGLIVRMVLPVLKLKYKPVSPEPLVFRFGQDLKLSVLVQKNASLILRKALNKGLRKMGKDPKGLAAAALYMAAKPTGERLTQTQIAGTARITEVTLRTRARQIQTYMV